MKNTPNHVISNTRNRNWQSYAAGLAVGIASMISAQILDAMLTGTRLDLMPFLGHYALTAATFALAYSPVLQALMPTRTRRLGIDWRVVHSSTIAFVPFLIPVMIAAPDSTGRWLPYSYAFSLVFGWLAWQVLDVEEDKVEGFETCQVSENLTGLEPDTLRSHQARPLDISHHAISGHPRPLLDLRRLPYGPFVVAGLVLLIATAVCSFAGQRSATVQMANWAYGFLLLAVLSASLCLLLDRGISNDKLRTASRFVLPVASLAFFPLALFVDANSSSAAEKQVITDAYPNFLLQQLRPGDILISDSPALRLGSIPQLGSSLSIDPDQRGQALWDDLARALDDQRRALWISVPGQSHDSQGTLATFLKANGCLDYVSDSTPPVRVYELNKPLTRPSVLSPYSAAHTANAFDPVTVNFGPILLTGIRYERRACSHDSVAVAMHWQLPAKTASPLRLSLFLTDEKGRRIQTQDFYIDDPNQRHTDQWQSGASLPAYYLLAIPLGTPPGIYNLGAAVYPVAQPQWLRVAAADGVQSQSDHVTLGTVQVYRAQDVSADPWKSRRESGMQPANVAVSDGLVLDGYQVTDSTIIPGEPMHLALRWRTMKEGLPSYSMNVSLRQGNNLVSQGSGVPVDGTYPTDHWRFGEYVVERRDLLVPADASGGFAQLEVSVSGGKTVYLADINIEPITRTYQMPSIGHVASASFGGVGELIGYELSSTSLDDHQPLDVTLYWRAGRDTAKDYTVFAQLLSADGRLIAQSDSQPTQGRRPMRSWLAGEIITDLHSLDFKDPSYQGDAKLIVGLYNPETGERIPIEGATDNYYLLPTPMQVVSK